MEKKILFIQPALYFSGINFEKEFPAHIVYLASYLHDKLGDHAQIEFLDLGMERILDKRLDMLDKSVVTRIILDKIDKVFQFSGNSEFFVVISCHNSFHYIPTKIILSSIKRAVLSGCIPKPTVIVGGYHPTILPNDFEGAFVDYVVRGEGELTLYEIIRDQNVTTNYRENWDGGVQLRILDGKITHNLDELPLTNFELYQPYIEHYPRLSFSLSRGCPYSCEFCVEKRYDEIGEKRKRWRAYSVTRAKQELDNIIKISDKYMKGGPDRVIGLYDPIFGLNLRWRYHVLNYLIEKDSGYKFWTETRIDAIKKEQVRLFKKSNLYFMLGLESGSPKMLLLMNKTRQPEAFLSNLKKFLSYAKELDYGPLVFNLVFNFPGENKKSAKETFSFLDDIIDSGIFFTTTHQFFTYYPGSGVYNSLETWVKKFGTKVYIPNWWLQPETMRFSDYIDASREFKYNKASTFYYEMMKTILWRLIDVNDDLRFRFELLRRLKKEKINYDLREQRIRFVKELAPAPFSA
ncbi:MAG: B12-binding domain-containing radical SAM protein [Promethearchaeota archaeon]